MGKRGRRVATKEEMVARFWSRVNKTETCWLWTAALHSAGYGVIRINGNPGTLIYAHRFAYELANGPIPQGKHLDHLCRVHNCVNPSHLEAVEPRVNWERGISPSAVRAKQAHCIRGHELSGANLYLRPDTGARGCLKCRHENWERWYAENKEKINERARLKSKGLASL